MGIKTLYKSGALGSGAQLWILPEISNCSWAKKIDWYLNLQLSKAHLYSPANTSENIKDILKANDWDEPDIKTKDHAFLMVASEGHLPSQQIVRVAHQPFAKSKDPLQSWIDDISAVWENLGNPSLRIFLPDNYSAEEFLTKWKPAQSRKTDITIVPSAASTET